LVVETNTMLQPQIIRGTLANNKEPGDEEEYKTML